MASCLQVEYVAFFVSKYWALMTNKRKNLYYSEPYIRKATNCQEKSDSLWLHVDLTDQIFRATYDIVFQQWQPTGWRKLWGWVVRHLILAHLDLWLSFCPPWGL